MATVFCCVVGLAGELSAALDAEATDPCTISGTPGDDVMTGTPRDDVICGFGGDDVLMGAGGKDRLLGGSGNDRLQGGGDNDRLRGGAGDDQLDGGGGDDNLRGGPGADRMSGGAGRDLGDYLAADVAVSLSAGNGANDGEKGEGDELRSDVENLRGGSGNDSLQGNGGANWLHGFGGNDRLRGGMGNDDLFGGMGRDTLDGRDASSFSDDLFCGGGEGDGAMADTDDNVRDDCENVDQNDAPTDLTLSKATVAENEPAATTVGTLSVTDPDAGDSHTYSLVAGAGSGNNGSFTLAGTALRTNAAFDYETKSSYSIRVGVTDAEGGAYEEQFTISVTNVVENLAPVAVDDAAAATEDVELQLPVSGAGSPAANDTDPDSDPLTVSAVSGATGGTASIVSGTIRFQPAANLCGAAGFDYTVSDGRGGTDVGRVTVTVACTPDDPILGDDTATVAEDAVATTIDVLANDSDPDGDPVTIDTVSVATNGTVVITNLGADLTYEPDADFCGSDSFTYTVVGGVTATVDVTVTCVNDAPVVTPATVALAENSANGTAVHTVAFTDVEAGQAHSFAITAGNTGGAFAIDPTSGAITVANSAALDFETTPSFALTVEVTDDGTPPQTGAATITVNLTDTGEPPVVDPATFTVAENAAAGTDVGTVTFTDPDAGQSHTFAITAGNTGGAFAINPTTGAITVAQPPNFEATPSYSLTVEVTDDGTPALSGSATITVNVTDVNESPSITAPTTVSANRDVLLVVAGISVADPDAGDIELTLAVDNGTLNVNETASTAVVTGDGTDTVVITGTVGEINAILGATNGVVYLNDAGFLGATDTMHLDVDDLGSPALTASATVTIQFNQPPVAAAVTATTNEGTPVAVTLSGTDGDDDNLAFSIVSGPASGTLGAIGPVDCTTTPNTCTAQVTYTPTGDFNGSDQLTYQVDDGQDTDTGTVNITVNAVNDAPVITLSGSTPSFTEGGPAANVDDGLTVIDIDDTNLVSGTVSISVGLVSGDALSFTSVGGITDTNLAPEVLALSGTATVADWQSVLRSVQFFSTSDNPTNAARTVSFVVNDGEVNSNTAQKTVAVVPVNDAPVVTTSIGATAFAEDGGPVTVDSGVTVTDADNTTLASAAVTITNAQNGAAEVLAATPSGAILAGDISYTAPTLTITRAGAPLADYQAVLRSVTYNITSNDPTTTPSRAISFQANDGTAGSVVGASSTKTVTVSETNDAPVAGDDTLTAVLEDSATRVIPFADLLGNDTTGGEVGQTLTITNVSGPTGGTVAINGTNIEFTPTANFFGAAGFTYTVTDDGTTGGTADPKSDTAAVSFTITAVNDEPSFTKGADQTVNEDAGVQTVNPWATAISTGPANESGQTVTFLVGNNNNSLFTAGGQPAVSPAGVLTYTPAANQNGVATVTIAVQDNGGTANGGDDTSPNQTFTITVNPVNDKPVVTAPPAYTVQANMKRDGLTGLLANVTDADTGTGSPPCDPTPFTVTTGSISATTPAGGTVSNLNTSTGTFDFDPPPNYSGNVTFTFTVDDDGCPGVATSDPVTVTINVTGPVIIFVNPSVAGPGDGRLSNPFKFLSGNAGTTNDADDVDEAGDRIFVYNAAAATGGITLNDNEWLIGQGLGAATGFDTFFGITPPSGTITRPSFNATHSTVQGTVTVGTNSHVRGLDVSVTGTSQGLVGSGETGVQVSEVDVTSVSGNAVDLTNTTADFTGGNMSITSAGGNGFEATGGGSVTVQGGSNTIGSGMGTALNVAGATIGGNDLTFRSISASSAANGIVLNTTGSAGSLVVTGDGDGNPDGGGGTIQSTSSHGVSLNSTLSPSLSDVAITNAGDADNEYGLLLINVGGTVALDDMSFNNAADNLVYLTSTTSSTVNVTGSTFTYPGTIGPTANSAILLEPGGAANLTASVTGSTFTNILNASTQIGANTAGASGTLSLTFSNNTINSATGRAGGVVVSGQELTTTSLTITNNTFTGAGGNGVVSIDTNDTSTVNGSISNNVITNPPGIGIFSAVDEAATSTLTFNGNTITNSGGDGIQLVNFGGVGSSTMNATVTNNTVNGHSLNTAVSFVGGISATGFEEVMDLQLTGNTVTGTPAGPTQCGGAPCVDYYLEEVSGTFRLEEIPDTAATTASAAYVNVTNDAGPVTIFGVIDLSNGVEISSS
jgi:Cadherin domain/Bacterial Ig domain/RTX calcium-binding nonapeptide repeat (4 copies)